MFDIIEILYLICVLVIILSCVNIAVLLFFGHRKYQHQMQQRKGEHLLLITAHPDDESMFFGPTIGALRNSRVLHLLCLTNGNAAGLGKVREKELLQVVNYWRIKHVKNIDDPRLPDSMTVAWDKEVVAGKIRDYLRENPEIKTILTFDEYGISGHANHRAVHNGVMHLIQTKDLGDQVRVFVLKSVSIIRKYIGILDFILGSLERSVFFTINVVRGMKSMWIHRSQFVWYRALFVLFSRYTYVNHFKQLK